MVDERHGHAGDVLGTVAVDAEPHGESVAGGVVNLRDCIAVMAHEAAGERHGE